MPWYKMKAIGHFGAPLVAAEQSTSEGDTVLLVHGCEHLGANNRRKLQQIQYNCTIMFPLFK